MTNEEMYERDMEYDSAYYEEENESDPTLDPGFSSWDDFNSYMYG